MINLLKPPEQLRRGFKDKRRLALLANYGCQVCELLGEPQTTKTELHHLAGIGAGMKASDLLCFVLCLMHHTAGEDAIHKGIAEFEEKFKSQKQFIFEVNERIFKDNVLKGKDLEHYFLIREWCNINN